MNRKFHVHENFFVRTSFYKNENFLPNQRLYRDITIS
jgi:hypothetical protein